MKSSVLFLFALSSFRLFSQTYTVGTQTITYTDAARSNRSVGVEFRYPGTNTAVDAGPFPFVIFAHGFQMDQVPYYPYADSLAKQGYIVGLLTTETSLSPSHASFAQDLIFVYNKLISESNGNNASIFYQKVIPKGALGGHSMGGGSTVLSCQYSNPATCYFTFAAANTNPSSIAAAPSMTKPYLAFAGSRDCIAPIATHQRPMYDSSASACKFLINITDALHCQFGNGNFQCNFGEGFSGCASSPLSRTSQINKTLLFLVPYLNYYLKGDCSAWTLFESRYASNTDVMFRNCTNVIPTNPSISGNSFFCNGGSTTLTANPASFTYVWSDNSTSNTLNVSTAGNYSIVVGNGVCSLSAVSVSVTENSPPATPSAITASDTVCSNIANLNISVVNDPNVSYNWTLPNGWNITSGNNSNSIEVTSGMNGGTISVSAQNLCGTSDPVATQITVIPSSLGVPSPIIGIDTICIGDALVLSFTTSPVAGADSLLWSSTNSWVILSGQGSESITVAPASGNSIISVSGVNSCGASVPQSINVAVLDTPQVIITQQSNQLVSQTTGLSYQWYLNGILLLHETNQSITPTQSGSYSLVMTDENGCSGTSEETFFVFNGVEELYSDMLQISPNPNSTGGLLHVTNNYSSGEITIFNTTGQIVLKSEIDSIQTEIDISSLSKGMYVVSFRFNQGTVLKKLVVE